MPYKHQSESYRTRNGVRYQCWVDGLTDEATAEHMAAIRSWGFQAIRIKDRVFVEPAYKGEAHDERGDPVFRADVQTATCERSGR